MPKIKDETESIINEIASHITFYGQTKKEIKEDAKKIGEYMVQKIIDSIPEKPYENLRDRKSEALRFWLRIKKSIVSYEE